MLSIKTRVAQFHTGFTYPLRAWRFLQQHRRKLGGYVVFPFLINIVVFSVISYLALFSFNDLLARYLPQGEAWYFFLIYCLAWLLGVLVFVVFIFFCFTVVGNLIAAPFNDLLSEKTEQLATAEQEESAPFSLLRLIKESGEVLLEEVKKISLFVVAMLLLLPLNLIPAAGPPLYGFLSLVLTIFFLVIEYTGYFFSRKQISFREQRSFVRQHLFLCAGFGCGIFLLLAIPFLQLLSIPMGVIGATLLCTETQKPPKPAQPERI